ncbi:MAG: twin-arginine translocase TatA/TatE family subunit [Myxococcales bacterium]|nr:twin-arginine translocase TatA/TatE family subunit [Myxococcales bacterium]
MSCIGFQEGLIIVFVITLVVGASRLPLLGESLGRSIRNFKKGFSGDNEIDVTARSRIDAGEDEDRRS